MLKGTGRSEGVRLWVSQGGVRVAVKGGGDDGGEGGVGVELEDFTGTAKAAVVEVQFMVERGPGFCLYDSSGGISKGGGKMYVCGTTS